MKKLTIEWRHYDKDGQTCDRCRDTGQTIEFLRQKFASEWKEQSIEIEYIETKLPASRLAESNLVLINGRRIEDIIPNTQVAESECPSCSNLIGCDSDCRTIVEGGAVYEALPEKMLLKAIGIALR